MAQVTVERLVSTGNFCNVKLSASDEVRPGELVHDAISRLEAVVDARIQHRRRLVSLRRRLRIVEYDSEQSRGLQEELLKELQQVPEAERDDEQEKALADIAARITQHERGLQAIDRELKEIGEITDDDDFYDDDANVCDDTPF